MTFPPFVKKFDFRGVYNTEIKNQDAFYLALAIKKIFPLKKVLVGWDTRVSSKNLAMNFIHGLENSDIEISYVETCPIDYVTCGAYAFDFDFSVMFTGSHNTWDWTGLLMHTQGGVSVEGKTVSSIVESYNQVLQEPYTAPAINLANFLNAQEKIEVVYQKKIQSLIPLEQIKKLNVIVDLGDGSGSKSLDLIERLLPQVEFTRLNDRKLYDAQSSHTADPSESKNMQQLMETMKKNGYDGGFAFDSDADRVLAVDETGAYINGSLIGSAIIEAFTHLAKHDNTYGYAVECGPAMYNAVVDIHKKMNSQISALPVPVGRSILRRMIRDDAVDVAVENVGHFYVKEFFMTDSAAFSLVIVLYWISIFGSLFSLRDKHPDGKRIQFSLPLAENQDTNIQKIIETITSHFAQKQIKKIEIDGIRYEILEADYLQSWFTVRQSGYEKINKYYFGSLNDDDYRFLQETIKKE